jgi:hypothetical protein
MEVRKSGPQRLPWRRWLAVCSLSARGVEGLDLTPIRGLNSGKAGNCNSFLIMSTPAPEVDARSLHKITSLSLFYPKIISARNGDDVIHTEPVWRRRSRIARWLALAARPCPTPDVCASHYNRPSTRSAPAANVVCQRSGRDPSGRAEASR